MMTGTRGPAASLARMVRQSCPTCGSRLLHWFTGAEFRHYLTPVQVDELEEFFGAAHLRQLDQDTECWRCPRCHDFGVFSGA